MKIHPFCRALQAILPAAELTLASACDWSSLTFDGQQLVIECAFVSGADAKQVADSVHHHEFSIPKILVADVAVTKIARSKEIVCMTIEAVLIKE